MGASRRLGWMLAGLTLAGCVSHVGDRGHVAEDSGSFWDAGFPEPEDPPDAGEKPDAGSRPDAGKVSDAGVHVDGGQLPDAGVPPPVDAGVPPVPVVPGLSAMVLGFHDEFEGAAGARPDSAKWQFSFTGANMTDYASGAFTDISLPVLTGNGLVELPGKYRGGAVTSSASYSMSGLYSHNHFTVFPTAGNRVYVEWRAKLPTAGAGVWPALWGISSGSAPNYNELDMMEQGSGIGPTAPFDVYFTDWLHNTGAAGYNYGAYDPATNPLGTKVPGGHGAAVGRPSLASGFHTYSMLWTTTAVTSFLDGVVSGDGTVPFSNVIPVNLVANFQIGGPGGGAPDGTGWPRSMYLDYCRVFRDF